MYECDICGKEFTNAFGAYIGIRRPPFYDRMVYCKSCNEYIKNKNPKMRGKEVNYNEATRKPVST